ELGIDAFDLASPLSRETLDFASPDADAVAKIAADPNPAFRKLAGSFAARAAGKPRRLDPDPIGALLTQALADLALDRDELDALRRLSTSYGGDRLRTQLEAQKITEATRGPLLSLLDFGMQNFQTLGA